MLGFVERLHPELDNQFTKPDKTIPDERSAAELRRVFDEVNCKLTAEIEALPALDWLKPHSAISEEDFAKEPLRNRLSVLLSRTAHATFHAGQIRLTQ